MVANLHAQTLVNLQKSSATGAPDPSLNWTKTLQGLGAGYHITKIKHETQLNDFTLETSLVAAQFVEGSLSSYYTSTAPALGSLATPTVLLSSTQAGMYIGVDIYKYTSTFSISIPGGNVLDYWVRGNTTNVLGTPEAIPSTSAIRFYGDPHFTLTGVTSTSATVEGYVYHILGSSGSWFPFDPSTEKGVFEFSVYSGPGTSGIKEEDSLGKLLVYPNPANDMITCQIFSDGFSGKGSLEIIGLSGQTVYQVDDLTILPGENSVTIDLAHFSHGLFVIKATVDKKLFVTKFLKN